MWTKLANLARDSEKTASPDESQAPPGVSTLNASALKRPRPSAYTEDQTERQSAPSSSAGDSRLTKSDPETEGGSPAATVADRSAAETRRGKGKGRGKRRRATAGGAGSADSRTGTEPPPPLPPRRRAEPPIIDSTIDDAAAVQSAEQHAKKTATQKAEHGAKVEDGENQTSGTVGAVAGVDAREDMAFLEEELRALLDLAARTKGLFEWVDGPLVTAMRKGEMILLDELSLAEDAVLERLNSVLEPGRSITLAERGGQSDSGGQGAAETVVAAPGFRFVRSSRWECKDDVIASWSKYCYLFLVVYIRSWLGQTSGGTISIEHNFAFLLVSILHLLRGIFMRLYYWRLNVVSNTVVVRSYAGRWR